MGARKLLQFTHVNGLASDHLNKNKIENNHVAETHAVFSDAVKSPPRIRFLSILDISEATSAGSKYSLSIELFNTEASTSTKLFLFAAESESL